MMPFKKHEKYAKVVVFTERKEAKRFFWTYFFLKVCEFEKLLIQNLTPCSNFNSKADAFFFGFKIWHFVQFLFQKLAERKVLFKNWRVVKFLIQKLIFCSFSGSSIKQLKERINRRSSQLVFAWYLVKPVCYVFVFLETDDDCDNHFFFTTNSRPETSLGSKNW